MDGSTLLFARLPNSLRRQRSRKAMTEAATPARICILVVDDNADDRRLIERTLRQALPGVQVEHVAVPAALGRALERGGFDLVITDYQLHWTSGLSVLLAVKERDPDMPVVMYTGTGSEETAVEVMRAGLDDYILKSPEHQVRLTAAVKAALARAAGRRRLREAEARYQSLFEESQAAILVIDPAQATVVDANPAACRFYGYPREKLVGMRVWELSANPRPVVEDRLRAALEGGERYFQAPHRLADGEVRQVEIYIGVMQVQGKSQLYGLIHDITDRKLAEEALRRERDFNRALVQTSPAFILVVSLDGKALMANEALLDALGCRMEEVVGQDFLSRYIPEEEREGLLGKFVGVEPKGLHVWGEVHLRARDGRLLLVEWHSQPVLGEGGQVEYFFGIGLDRTAQRMAEDATRDQARFPAENPNPVLRLAADGTVIYANPGSAGLMASWSCEVGRKAPDPWPEIVRRALASGEQTTIDAEHEGRVSSLTVAPIQVARVVNLYGQDVTERARAQADLHRRDAILEAVAFAVEWLLKAGNWREVIPQVLERLGRSVGVSRAYFFESHLSAQGEPVVSQRSEWVADGVSSQVDNPDTQGIPLLRGPLARWFGFLRRNEAFFGNTRQFSEEEREMLRGQGIRSLALVPIVSDEALWGFLGFDDCWVEREWAPREIEALRLAAGTLGAAIQRRRSEDVAARRAREMSALYQTSLEITSRARLPELLELIVRRAADLLGAPMGALYLMEPDRKSLRLAVPYNLPPGYVGAQLQLGEGLSGRVAMSGETMAVEDYQGWEGRAEVYRDSPFRRVLAIPLKRAGLVIGVINVTDTERVGPYDPEDVRLITLLADQAAIAIENSRLLEETERRAGVMDALYRTSLDITSRVGLPELLDTIVRRAASLIGGSMGGMYLTEPDGRSLRCVVSINLPQEYIGNRLTLGEGLAGRVAASGETVAVEDYRTWEGRAAIYADSPFRRVLGVPLKRAGQVIGVIDVVDTDRTGPYDPEEVRLVTLLADQAAIAIENSRLLEEMERRAEEMNTLYQTSLELAGQASLPDLLKVIVERAVRIVGCDNGSLYLMKPDGKGLEAAVIHNLPPKYAGAVRRLGQGLSGRAAAEGRPIAVEDYAAEDLFDGLYQDIPLGRAVAVPMRREGRVVGVLSVANGERTGPFSADAIRLVSLLADQAAIAIENTRLLAETERRAAHMEAITQVASALRLAPTRHEMLPIILDQLLDLFTADRALLALRDRETGETVTELARGQWAGLTGHRSPAGQGAAGRLIATGVPLIVPGETSQPDPAAGGKENALAGVPLTAQQELIGCLMVGRETPFAAEEIRILTAVAEMAGNALHRAGLMETLEDKVRERTKELGSANERLQELDRLKNEFVSNVSHELRAPISNILLYLELLSQPGRAERQPAYLGILRKEAERLRHLIEDLLALSRIERGAPTLEVEPHALDPLIAEVVAAQIIRAAAKGVQLVHEPNPELPVVWMSRAEIQQVLTNLITNAVSYSPPGAAVEVRTARNEFHGTPFITVRFHNSGPPISVEDLPHIFERFYRGRNAHLGGEPGTGLGLAICKEIVERHQGWIEVESLEDRGTTFAVWLPLRPRAGD
jgi:PAS domain S-box-containing protein